MQIAFTAMLTLTALFLCNPGVVFLNPIIGIGVWAVSGFSTADIVVKH
jgi:hypothetical protein